MIALPGQAGLQQQAQAHLTEMFMGVVRSSFAQLMQVEYGRAVQNAVVDVEGVRHLDIDFNTVASVAIESSKCLMSHLGVQIQTRSGVPNG